MRRFSIEQKLLCYRELALLNCLELLLDNLSADARPWSNNIFASHPLQMSHLSVHCIKSTTRFIWVVLS